MERAPRLKRPTDRLLALSTRLKKATCGTGSLCSASLVRIREPALFKNYSAPLYHMLPIAVVLLSAFAVYVYAGIDVKVIPLTALLYVLGLCYYWFWAHGRIRSAAPEELAARQAAGGGPGS